MTQKAKIFKFSTGTVQIRPQHVGPTRLPTLLWLLTARAWTQPRPINVYVIEHPLGVVVFDTGQDRASVTSSDYFPGGLVGWLYSRLAKFRIGENETFASGLAKAGVNMNSISYAVISHLHQDHIGGLPDLAHTGVMVVVSKDELAASKRRSALLDGYMENHIALDGITFDEPEYSDITALDIPGFETGWDIFRDGQLVVVPLAGHTAGSLGLIVNWETDSPCFLVGDLTYDAGLLDRGVVPGVGSKSALVEISNRVNHLKKIKPDLVLAAAHDPNVTLPDASE